MTTRLLLIITLLLGISSAFGQSFSYVNSVICENVNLSPPFNYINENNVFVEDQPVFSWVHFVDVDGSDLQVQHLWYSLDDPSNPIGTYQDVYPCCGEVISSSMNPTALPTGTYWVECWARSVGGSNFTFVSSNSFTVVPGITITVSNLTFEDGIWDFDHPFPLDTIDKTNYLTKSVKIAADGEPCTLVEINLNSQTPAMYKVFPTADPNGTLSDIYGYFELYSADDALIRYKYFSPTTPTQGLTINVTVRNEATGVNELPFRIKIVRPPVLLLHGMASNASTMNYLKSYLTAASYSEFPNGYVEAYDYNGWIPFSLTFNQVRNFNKLILTAARDNYKVSAGSVDVVGYSMGGLLSRMYLQSSNYDNDINKLITINTPHSGSELANNALAGWFAHLLKLYAIFELRTNSFSIRQLLNGNSLNAHIVPSHTITSTVNVACPGSNSNWPEGVQYQICNSLDFFCGNQSLADCIFDDPSDGVVSSISQDGGLDGGSVSNALSHSNVRESNLTAARLNTLLGSSTLSPDFSQSGFDPAIINANAIPSDRSTLSLDILSPADNAIYAPGQVVHFSIDGSDDVQKAIVGFYGSFLDSISTQRFNGSNLELDYTIPTNATGTLRMSIIGTDGNMAYAIDTLTLQIQASTPIIESSALSSPPTNFTVFPNPGTDGLTITSLTNEPASFVGAIFSTTGEKLLGFESSSKPSVTVEVSQLPKGVYLLHLQQDGSVWNSRWMKL